MSHDSSFPRLEVSESGDLQPCPSGLVQTDTALGPGPSPKRWPLSSSSVWQIPALKLIGFCCVLTCIAWLGERSRETTTYGPEIRTSSPASTPRALATLPPAPNAPASGHEEPPVVNAEAAPSSQAAAQPPPPCTPTTAVAPRPPALLSDGRLVLNEATAAELDKLPGIGKKRADDIVALRTRLGRFKRLSDLLRIRGIGHRSFRSLSEHLVLDRPQTAESEPEQSGSGGTGGPQN